MSGEGRCIRVAFCALEANFLELRHCEVRRIPILGSRVNKRSEGHLTRGGCRAKGTWAMERRRSATRSIHNNCVALAIL
jgi:hypothetical protein